MKHLLKLAGLIAIVGCIIFVASCSKDKKTCECTVAVRAYGQTQTQTVTGEIEDGNCESIPEIAQIKKQFEGISGVSFDIDCREI